ncbi:fibronectin type III domain-containing protein [Candidatus Parcubacteria bacterium]|nr:MAG: fibronectin type III domain-containing protein [Candidatus Parcubacteria bacterium]
MSQWNSFFVRAYSAAIAAVIGAPLIAAAAGAPFVATFSATAVSVSSATLQGSVNANGAPTTVWFEWGTSPAFGNTTSPQSVAADLAGAHITASLFGLQPGTIYYYRAVARNAYGTTYGNSLSFATLQAPGGLGSSQSTDNVFGGGSVSSAVGERPVIGNVSSEEISPTSVRLEGYVDPRAAQARVWVEYERGGAGPIRRTAAQFVTSGSRSPNVAFVLTGLVPHSFYGFRLVAENEFGKSIGGWSGFFTPSPYAGAPVPSPVIAPPQQAPQGGATVVAAPSRTATAPSPTRHTSRSSCTALRAGQLLSLQHFVSSKHITPGDMFHYTLTYTASSTSLAALTARVILPQGVSYVDSNIPPVDANRRVLEFSIGDLGAGGAGALDLTLRASPALRAPGSLVFNAAVSFHAGGEELQANQYLALQNSAAEKNSLLANVLHILGVSLLWGLVGVLILGIGFFLARRRKQRAALRETAATDIAPTPSDGEQQDGFQSLLHFGEENDEDTADRSVEENHLSPPPVAEGTALEPPAAP